MTPRPSHCGNHCDKNSPTSDLKCCAACKTVWYCSTACQKEDWPRHIFDCKLKRPIGTAYYLSRACREDLLPVHAQTRDDFGFEKAELYLGRFAPNKLMGLWKRVFLDLKVSEKEVQKWQAEGRMVEEVKAVFTRLPAGARGEYYAWFLQHPSILDGSPLASAPREDQERATKAAILEAWVHTGGSPSDSIETINAKLKLLPRDVQVCHQFYGSLWGGVYPDPRSELWITLGFVAAERQVDEFRISKGYGLLISDCCTFREFSTAYTTSSIPQLADRHWASMMASPSTTTYRSFRDVMSESPRRFKSVWYLKHYVDMLLCAEPGLSTYLPHRAIRSDYGWANCKSEAEWKMLDELYTKYFAHQDANPLDLHEACVRGELADYVSRFVKLKPKTGTYKRLLKNTYPLPHSGEPQGVASHDGFGRL